MGQDDLYKTLGVQKDASSEEIKAAYRKLARELHPDLNPGDRQKEEQFKKISGAYDILSDAEKRKKYDQGEIDAEAAERAAREFYSHFAGGKGGGKYIFRFGGSEGFDFDDLFGDPFRSERGVDRLGEDHRYSLKIDFLDAVNGAVKHIRLPGDRSLEVKIPPGVEDGSVLRLKGQGGRGSGKAPAGDALVELTVEPHRHFRRTGHDIELDFPITLSEAVLGAKVDVPTIDGSVQMTVPKGSNTGNRLRLKGKGVLDRANGRRGDQFVRLKVVLPESPDPELSRFLEQWSKEKPYNVRKREGLEA